MDAAIMTPAANPRSAFSTNGEILSFIKNTIAAPSVVPTNGINNVTNSDISYLSFHPYNIMSSLIVSFLISYLFSVPDPLFPPLFSQSLLFSVPDPFFIIFKIQIASTIYFTKFSLSTQIHTLDRSYQQMSVIYQKNRLLTHISKFSPHALICNSAILSAIL